MSLSLATMEVYVSTRKKAQVSVANVGKDSLETTVPLDNFKVYTILAS